MTRMEVLAKYRDMQVAGFNANSIMIELRTTIDGLDQLAELCLLPCSVQQKWCDGGINDDQLTSIVEAARTYRKTCDLEMREFAMLCAGFGIYVPH